MASLIEDALAVGAAGAAERFHVVGESLGGTVGLAMALAAPERVLSLTVSNGAHRGAGIVNVRSWRDDITCRGRLDWARRMTESRLFPGAVDTESRDWFYHQHLTCSAEAVLSLADLLLGIDLGEEVAAIAGRYCC